MIVVPPSTVLLPKGQHMAFREAVEQLFDCKGCVARMNIYSKAQEETVYLEFHPVPVSDSNKALVRRLLEGELGVGDFVMRPQLLLS
jgi:hypothetical protein